MRCVALGLVVLALSMLDSAACVTGAAVLIPAPFDEPMLVERGQIIGSKPLSLFSRTDRLNKT